MLDARRRPMGRFFYCLLPILPVWAVAHMPMAPSTAPVTTQVNDVVYRADGPVDCLNSSSWARAKQL